MPDSRLIRSSTKSRKCTQRCWFPQEGISWILILSQLLLILYNPPFLSGSIQLVFKAGERLPKSFRQPLKGSLLISKYSPPAYSYTLIPIPIYFHFVFAFVFATFSFHRIFFSLFSTKHNTRHQAGVVNRCLAVSYFRTGNPYYHRRWFVSRSCSGWEGVGPNRYGRQT